MSALILPLAMFLTWTAGGFDGDLPNRDGVVCPEGFGDYEHTETVTDNAIQTNRRCQALQDEYGGPELARYKGCAVDTKPRKIVYTVADIVTRDYERARVSCPSMGSPSFAFTEMQKHEHKEKFTWQK